MNCPHCNHPIPDAAVVKAAAAIIGKRKRPGAKGLVRNPAGRPAKDKRPTIRQGAGAGI